jgi:hypothetical protein
MLTEAGPNQVVHLTRFGANEIMLEFEFMIAPSRASDNRAVM